ncbi:peptide/nickel transport system permease protein [Geomicrobium halophilum]|uniref:Peptide/nickel transport system permease protein n=1 Tax=Geomicrobium halophilum TaxID=549000 RepID=A0A841PTX9_9BACL|nr:oligopeptide ABC transporter permease [Geomicrobium halophilum]MBB6450616.1 peptide/nickel transport system permease protein [Geomicrobium halophilum]
MDENQMKQEVKPPPQVTGAETLGKHESMLSIILKKFFQNKLAVIGLIMLTIIISSAIFAPWLATHDPNATSTLDRLAPPSAENWLGADHLGRDIYSRMLYAGQMSLWVGFAAMLSATTIGVVVGSVAGYFGGWIDGVLMRVVDIIISFPSIFLLITIVSVFRPSPEMLIIVFAILSWTGTARIVRSEFLSLKKREFVLAAQTLGLPKRRIIFGHILPNAIGPVIVAATLAIGAFIITESTLSFLGLGISPPTATWGNMLSDSQDLTVFLTAWYYPLFPGLMIFITVLSFNFVGDGLRDALDPRVVEK